MDEAFEQVKTKRKRCEIALTSLSTNASLYGPAGAKKRDIWPPFSSAVGSHSLVLSDQTAFRQRFLQALPDESPSVSALTILTSADKAGRLYEPLYKGNIIRLLEIQPGRYEDVLNFQFHYADLSKHYQRYEALSYIWGKDPFVKINGEYQDYKCTAFCDGYELLISANLEKALRNLRLDNDSRIVWVDAICINQGDIPERNHQVTLMSAVYGRASRVIAWLGGETERIPFESSSQDEENVTGELLFGAMTEVVNHWLSDNSPGQEASYLVVTSSKDTVDTKVAGFKENPDFIKDRGGRLRRKSSFQLNRDRQESKGKDRGQDPGLDVSEENAAKSPLWQAIKQLFENAWFWRLWVFQEITLARAAVMKWGTAEIRWEWVGLAAAILRTNYHGICKKMRIGGVYNAYLMFRSSRLSDLPRMKFDFLQLLRLTRQFEVTDPRDKIYALLGIATDDNDPDKGILFLSPDYTIDEGELWKQLAVKVLTKKQNLSILSSVQYQTGIFEAGRYIQTRKIGRSQKGRIPSWIPQWNYAFRTSLSPWDVEDTFSAAKGLSLTFGKPPESGSLEVEGVDLGMVGHATWFMWHDLDVSFLWASHLQRYFRTEKGLSLLARTLTAGRDCYGSVIENRSNVVADFVAYVLLLQDIDNAYGDDEFGYSRMSTEMSRPSLVEMKRFLSKLDTKSLRRLGEGGSATRFLGTALPFCETRRLFLTLNGFLGLGPDSLLEGDRLCILAGGDLPLLLRPVEESRGNTEVDHNRKESAGRFRLVGECYVEDLMKGEAVEALHSAEGFIGPVPPELVAKEILETAGKPLPIIRHSDAEDLGKKFKNKGLPMTVLAAARKEFKLLEMPQLEKRWFNIQ